MIRTHAFRNLAATTLASAQVFTRAPFSHQTAKNHPPLGTSASLLQDHFEHHVPRHVPLRPIHVPESSHFKLGKVVGEMKNPALEAFKQVYQGADSYQVEAFSQHQLQQKTAEACYDLVIRASMHRDMPIGIESGEGEFRQIHELTELNEMFSDEYNSNFIARKKEITSAVERCLKEGLLVMTGSGFSTDTWTAAIAVVDVKNAQFVRLIEGGGVDGID